MAEMHITKWKYSNESAEVEENLTKTSQYIQPGKHIVQIEDAAFDDSQEIYTIVFRDIETDAKGTFKYWLNKAEDENGDIKPNWFARGILINLGKALFGTDVGRPFPDDIIGGVVVGDFEMGKPNAAGKSYIKCNRFEPAPYDDASPISDIVQYYDGGQVE